MCSKGRTELQVSLSGATSDEEAAGDVHFCVFLRKTAENIEKSIFPSKNFKNFRKRPNASKGIWRHPNGSEQVRTGPNESENLEKLAKT